MGPQLFPRRGAQSTNQNSPPLHLSQCRGRRRGAGTPGSARSADRRTLHEERPRPGRFPERGRGKTWFEQPGLTDGGRVALVRRVPVDDVPERRNVVGTAILVVQVVRVLPDVEADDGRAALHQRGVLVGHRLDAERAVGGEAQPGPAAAEARGGRLGELLLEAVEAAERGRDLVAQRAGRRAALAGAHDGPKKRVVRVAAAVVAHGRADVLGHLAHVGHQRLDALVRKRRMVRERLVEVGHIGVVVLTVMDLHRLRVDVRLERIVRVRKGRQLIGHRNAPRGFLFTVRTHSQAAPISNQAFRAASPRRTRGAGTAPSSRPSPRPSRPRCSKLQSNDGSCRKNHYCRSRRTSRTW